MLLPVAFDRLAEDRRGQGLSTVLVRGVLDDVRSRGLLMTPQCSAVLRFVEKHPEYVDLVEPRVRPAFGL